KACSLLGIYTAEMRFTLVFVHVDVEHRRMLVVCRLQGLSDCSRSHGCASSWVIQVIFIDDAVETVCENQQRIRVQCCDAAQEETYAFGCEYVRSSQVLLRFIQQSFCNLKENPHRNALMCSARISAGRSCALTPFHDQVCHVRPKI